MLALLPGVLERELRIVVKLRDIISCDMVRPLRSVSRRWRMCADRALFDRVLNASHRTIVKVLVTEIIMVVLGKADLCVAFEEDLLTRRLCQDQGRLCAITLLSLKLVVWTQSHIDLTNHDMAILQSEDLMHLCLL